MPGFQKFRHKVTAVADSTEELQKTLNEIAQEGGKVTHVLWTPSRPGGDSVTFGPGYVVTSEYGG